VKSAEEYLSKPANVNDLQNQTNLARGEIQAIRSELATVSRQVKLDHAEAQEEKDGGKNEE
jgi:hypothetical protein